MINRHLGSLGYEAAALLFGTGIAITIARLALAESRPTLIGAAAFLMACSVAGRILGVVFAEWRLRATIDRLCGSCLG